jgi:hypothetical protein
MKLISSADDNLQGPHCGNNTRKASIMAGYFLPKREIDLLNWSTCFRDAIVLSPTDFGLNPLQAADYSAAHDAFQDLYDLASSPSTRTSSIIQAKNDAEKALRAEARTLAAIVRAAPGVTSQQRVDLGLSVRNPGGSSPRLHQPSTRPIVTIINSNSRPVLLRIFDSTILGRGKPKGYSDAVVIMHVGDTPPLDHLLWTFCGSTSRGIMKLNVPGNVPGGAKVWVAACWRNPRGELGPASEPLSFYAADTLSRSA